MAAFETCENKQRGTRETRETRVACEAMRKDLRAQFGQGAINEADITTVWLTKCGPVGPMIHRNFRASARVTSTIPSGAFLLGPRQALKKMADQMAQQPHTLVRD